MEHTAESDELWFSFSDAEGSDSETDGVAKIATKRAQRRTTTPTSPSKFTQFITDDNWELVARALAYLSETLRPVAESKRDLFSALNRAPTNTKRRLEYLAYLADEVSLEDTIAALKTRKLDVAAVGRDQRTWKVTRDPYAVNYEVAMALAKIENREAAQKAFDGGIMRKTRSEAANILEQLGQAQSIPALVMTRPLAQTEEEEGGETEQEPRLEDVPVEPSEAQKLDDLLAYGLPLTEALRFLQANVPTYGRGGAPLATTRRRVPITGSLLTIPDVGPFTEQNALDLFATPEDATRAEARQWTPELTENATVIPTLRVYGLSEEEKPPKTPEFAAPLSERSATGVAIELARNPNQSHPNYDYIGGSGEADLAGWPIELLDERSFTIQKLFLIAHHVWLQRWLEKKANLQPNVLAVYQELVLEPISERFVKFVNDAALKDFPLTIEELKSLALDYFSLVFDGNNEPRRVALETVLFKYRHPEMTKWYEEWLNRSAILRLDPRSTEPREEEEAARREISKWNTLDQAMKRQFSKWDSMPSGLPIARRQSFLTGQIETALEQSVALVENDIRRLLQFKRPYSDYFDAEGAPFETELDYATLFEQITGLNREFVAKVWDVAEHPLIYILDNLGSLDVAENQRGDLIRALVVARLFSATTATLRYKDGEYAIEGAELDERTAQAMAFDVRRAYRTLEALQTNPNALTSVWDLEAERQRVQELERRRFQQTGRVIEVNGPYGMQPIILNAWIVVPNANQTQTIEFQWYSKNSDRTNGEDTLEFTEEKQAIVGRVDTRFRIDSPKTQSYAMRARIFAGNELVAQALSPTVQVRVRATCRRCDVKFLYYEDGPVTGTCEWNVNVPAYLAHVERSQKRSVSDDFFQIANAIRQAYRISKSLWLSPKPYAQPRAVEEAAQEEQEEIDISGLFSEARMRQTRINYSIEPQQQRLEDRFGVSPRGESTTQEIEYLLDTVPFTKLLTVLLEDVHVELEVRGVRSVMVEMLAEVLDNALTAWKNLLVLRAMSIDGNGRSGGRIEMLKNSRTQLQRDYYWTDVRQMYSSSTRSTNNRLMNPREQNTFQTNTYARERELIREVLFGDSVRTRYKPARKEGKPRVSFPSEAILPGDDYIGRHSVRTRLPDPMIFTLDDTRQGRLQPGWSIKQRYSHFSIEIEKTFENFARQGWTDERIEIMESKVKHYNEILESKV